MATWVCRVVREHIRCKHRTNNICATKKNINVMHWRKCVPYAKKERFEIDIMCSLILGLAKPAPRMQVMAMALKTYTRTLCDLGRGRRVEVLG